MTGIPFISSLFTSIFNASYTIEGRFYISSKNGNEINSDVLGQVLTDTITQSQQQKYPLVLMTAPVSRGKFSGNDQWKSMQITLLFLRPSYYNEFNQIEDTNPYTQTSMRPIISDWAEMESCAVDFVRVLDNILRATPTISAVVRININDKVIVPISTTGIDRVSGVRLDMNVSVFVGCVIEDYPQDIVIEDPPFIYSPDTPCIPMVEIIPYGADDYDLTVGWTLDRKKKFGIAPDIEVYYTESSGGIPVLTRDNLPVITTDAVPPLQTEYNFKLNAPGPGYIKFK